MQNTLLEHSLLPGLVSAFFFSSLEAGSQYMVHTGFDIRPAASASHALGLEVCATTPTHVLILKHSSSKSV